MAQSALSNPSVIVIDMDGTDEKSLRDAAAAATNGTVADQIRQATVENVHTHTLPRRVVSG